MRVRHTAPLLAAVALALTGCREAQPPTWPTPTPAPTSTTTRPAPTSTPTSAPPTTTVAPTTTPAPTTTVRPTPPLATTTVAPAPPTGRVPVGSREIFRGDFNTGNLGQYLNLQTRDRNGPPGGYCSLSACVRDGGPGHPTAARFDVGPGDVPDFGGGERAEVRAPEVADVREGDERWYEFSLKFEGEPPTGQNSGYHSIVMQWHAGSGSPPLHLSLDARGNLILWHRWDSYSKVIGPVGVDEWHDYVVHVKFSRSAAGFVEIYRDGKLAVPKVHRANMSSGSNYLKLGLYRGQESFHQVVWHDGLRITAP